MYIYIYVYIYISSFIYWSIHLSIYPFIDISTADLPIYLSIYLSIFVHVLVLYTHIHPEKMLTTMILQTLRNRWSRRAACPNPNWQRRDYSQAQANTDTFQHCRVLLGLLLMTKTLHDSTYRNKQISLGVVLA